MCVCAYIITSFQRLPIRHSSHPHIASRPPELHFPIPAHGRDGLGGSLVDLRQLGSTRNHLKNTSPLNKVYMYVYVCIYIYIYISKYRPMYIYVEIYLYIHVDTYIYIYVYTKSRSRWRWSETDIHTDMLVAFEPT